MPARRGWATGRAVVVTALLGAPLSQSALAYGPQGHLAAGRLAEMMLCPRALAAVADLAAGDDLGEVGLWADRIRSDPAYSDSAPWHFVNVEPGSSLGRLEHPPEGDVLWAIDHFSERLGDPGLARAERQVALRFLVHFVVDIHQPLHVGLAADRGGNAIPLRFRGESTNLHRLWDTDAIAYTGLPGPALVRAIGQDPAAGTGLASLDPLIWAEESRNLLPAVYEFGPAGYEPSAAYLEFAARTTLSRLALAAERLAGTLNSILCD